MNGQAIALGCVAGLGCVFIVSWCHARMMSLAVRVTSRLRPRLGGAESGSRLAVNPQVSGRVVSVLVENAVRMVDRWGSPAAHCAHRLTRAGSPLTVAQFRAEQVVWGTAGIITGTAMAGFLVARGAPFPSLVVMVACCGLSGGALRDYMLSRAIRRREARILSELPTIADLFALSVSAGEGASAAVERIARDGTGSLAEEFQVVVGEIRTGTSLAKSLHSLAGRTGVPALSRFATGVAIGVERGTPLADMLHAQALDVREAGRRNLIEEGGKREIAMMIPVIFLLLPVTVVFAVFPGIMAIRFGA